MAQLVRRRTERGQHGGIRNASIGEGFHKTARELNAVTYAERV